MKVIYIRFDGYEYRVPGPDKTEAQAYYTDSKEDAIATMKEMYKPEVVAYKIVRTF